MIDITVIRGPGLVQGDDIIDPLLATLAAALARGEHELNETATGKIEKVIEVPFRVGLEPGQFLYVSDDLLQEHYLGKLVNIDINVVASPPAGFMQLRILVPDGFFNPLQVVNR